jgi:hypothetical protein
MKFVQILLLLILIIILNIHTSCDLPAFKNGKTKQFFLDTIIKKQKSYKTPKKNDTYFKLPAWFVDKPEIRGINLSYAYSAIYYNKKTEMHNLLENAAENINKSKSVQITVLNCSTQQTGKFIVQTEVEESDAKIDVSNLEKNYTILNRFELEKGILALAVETSHLKEIPTGFIPTHIVKLDIQHPPEWAITPPVKKGYYFGIGTAQDHSSPQKAWMIAERNARADIARQYNLLVLHTRDDYQREMWEWMAYNDQTISRVSLKNVSIIKHSYYQKDSTYYALARVKEIDIE